MTNKNKKTLESFTKYCKENPELRFWQALRNWSGHKFIYVSDELIKAKDTFYFKGPNK